MNNPLLFEGFPGTFMSLLYFEDVENGAMLRESIAAKTLGADAAFIDAETIPDIFLLHVSAFKALVSQRDGTLKTRSLHAEIIFNMSGSKHIASALTTFGVSATTKRLIIARINATDEELSALGKAVTGSEIPIEKCTFGDGGNFNKLFKATDAELSIGSNLDAALCKAALLEC